MRFRLGLLLAVALATAACDNTDADQDVVYIPFDVIAKGDGEQLSPEFRIIESQDELNEVFQDFFDIPSIPQVDFTTRRVAYLTIGRQSTGQYDVYFNSISMRRVENGMDNALVFRWTAVTPGINCPTNQSVTSPYIFVSYKISGGIPILIGQDIGDTPCS